MKSLITFSLILFGYFCNGQNHRIDSLFAKFKNDIEIEQREYFGKIEWDNETKESYYTLMNFCQAETILKFTEDSNPIIRVYMFLGLLRINDNKELQKQILHKHRNDSIIFIERKGGVVLSWKVNEYMQMLYKAKLENKLSKLNYTKEINKIENEPLIVINGAHHGIIEKKELQKVDSLSYSKNEIKVSSFRISMNSKTMFSKTNKLTENMKNEINRLNIGDKIYFEEIKAMMEDNEIRNVGSLNLKIR